MHYRDGILWITSLDPRPHSSYSLFWVPNKGWAICILLSAHCTGDFHNSMPAQLSQFLRWFSSLTNVSSSGHFSVRRLLADGQIHFSDDDDDVDLLLIDATRDRNEAVDVAFDILTRPDKSFEEQRKFLERLLRRVEDESSKIEILKCFVEKFSQP